jgi:hypothetical protein
LIYRSFIHPQSQLDQPADGSPQLDASGYFLIACSAFSIASMQPTTKDARSRFITFSLLAFSLQNICRAGLPLLRGLFILGAYSGNGFDGWKGKCRKKRCDQNDETNSAQIVAPIS